MFPKLESSLRWHLRYCSTDTSSCDLALSIEYLGCFFDGCRLPRAGSRHHFGGTDEAAEEGKELKIFSGLLPNAYYISAVLAKL